MTHKCMAPSCKLQIPLKQNFCRFDWALLPESLREAIQKKGSGGKAIRAAVEWIRALESRPNKPKEKLCT